MEGEGIMKFWKTNPMRKRPMARTVAMEARASRGVSEVSCGVAAAVKRVAPRGSFVCLSWALVYRGAEAKL
jgi:hypothetical protein